jgi:hypothetical protein
MPTTAEEREVAQNALSLGDKEMDLAFATAVREAEQHPPALNAEAKEIEVRLQKSESAVAADQTKVAQLTAEDGKARGRKKDELDARLSLAKAQLELDQDEVDDGKEDLGRTGGDQQARIQALTQQHEAASQISDNTHITVTGANEQRGLIHRFQQWLALQPETDAIVAGEGRGGSGGGNVLGKAQCVGGRDPRAQKGFAGSFGGECKCCWESPCVSEKCHEIQP